MNIRIKTLEIERNELSDRLNEIKLNHSNVDEANFKLLEVTKEICCCKRGSSSTKLLFSKAKDFSCYERKCRLEREKPTARAFNRTTAM